MSTVRALVLLLTVVAATAAKAQGTHRLVRLGFVDPDAQLNPLSATDAFWERLRELGWVRNKNFTVVYRSTEGRADRFPTLVDEVLKSKVDILVTSTTPGAFAAKKATSTIPIVVLAFGDPVGSGLVATLAHPGGNLTGFSLEPTAEVTPKYLQILKEMVPRLSTTAIISNPNNPQIRRQVAQLKSAAAEQHAHLRFIDVHAPEDFADAFIAAHQDAEALLVLSDSITVTHRKAITELAMKYRIPTLYTTLEFVRIGGLIGYGADQNESYRGAAEYVDKILRGSKPGELPIQQRRTSDCL